MMTTLYLIRHGTTDYNVNGRFQGTLQIPLNEQGLLQAGFLAGYLANAPLNAVYSSPLERAKQTADAVCLPHGLTLRIHTGLREIFGGDLEGHTGAENDLNFPDAMKNFREHPPLFAAPNGESAHEVYTRIVRTMEEIVRESPNEAIAVVSHGYAIQAYLAYVMERQFDKMQRHIVGNASVTVLHCKDGKHPEIVDLDLQDYLPADLRFCIAANFMKA